MRKKAANLGFKYILVGGCNFVFGYFIGVSLYLALIDYCNIILIAIISNIFGITFSFLTYRKYVFESKKKWIKEYFKCYLVYGSSAALSIVLIWIFVGKLELNIWIGQAFSLILISVASFFGHRNFTFNSKYD